MLDREGKREKILEGKLREIRIKLKKQQEQQEFLLRQVDKTAEDIKDETEVKAQLSKSELSMFHTVTKLSEFRGKSINPALFFMSLTVLIETAEREFHQATEEELQRRIKDQTKLDHDEHNEKSGHKKRSKARRVETQETAGQNGNSDQKSENSVQRTENSSSGAAVKSNERSSFAEL